MLQAPSKRTKSAGHRAGINHGKHRQAETLRQVCSTRVTIKQPHHAFNNDEISFSGRLMQTSRAILLPGHPQIQLVNRCTTGKREPARVKEIRAALEDAHLPTLPRMQPRKRAGHSRLSLAGSRGGDEDGGTGGRQAHQ